MLHTEHPSLSATRRLLHLQPSDQGMVTLAGYLRFWGWLFTATTVLLALFKREDNAG